MQYRGRFTKCEFMLCVKAPVMLISIIFSYDKVSSFSTGSGYSSMASLIFVMASPLVFPH